MKLGYSSVRKYMLNNHIDIEKLTTLVFPLSLGLHWFTVEVDMTNKAICIYDSMHEPSSLRELSYITNSSVKSVVEYLNYLFDISTYKWIFLYTLYPQPPNGYDCGIHTCTHTFLCVCTCRWNTILTIC